MHTTNLRKVGGSIMLAVPPDLLDTLRLGPGARVSLAIQRGRLVMDPRPKPRYTMDELLAQSKPKRRRGKQERIWLGDKPVGREVI